MKPLDETAPAQGRPDAPSGAPTSVLAEPEERPEPMGASLESVVRATLASPAARADSSRAGDEPGLTGPALLATALAETAAGLTLGHGGLWPDGAEPWSLLAAAALVAPGALVARGSRRAAASLALLALSAIGLAIASSLGTWVGLWVGAGALLAHASHWRRSGPWLGAWLFALCRVSNVALALAYGQGASGASPAPGFVLLAALYGVLSFCVFRIDRTAARARSTPSKRPIDLLTVGAWALVAVPLVPFVPGSDLLGRGIALVLIALGAPGFIHLVRRKRRWDRRAVATATLAGTRCMQLFSAAALVLTWTYTSIAVAALILAGAYGTRALARLRAFLADDPGLASDADSARDADGPALSIGLEQLERTFGPGHAPVRGGSTVDEELRQAVAMAEAAALAAAAAAAEEHAELARTREELESVRAKLARAESAGSTGSGDARTDLLERRIQKLLKTIQKTEDELARVARARAAEPGVRSIYREVQGISAGDEQHGQKSQLLGALFEANLELRRQRDAGRPR